MVAFFVAVVVVADVVLVPVCGLVLVVGAVVVALAGLAAEVGDESRLVVADDTVEVARVTVEDTVAVVPCTMVVSSPPAEEAVAVPVSGCVVVVGWGAFWLPDVTEGVVEAPEDGAGGVLVTGAAALVGAVAGASTCITCAGALLAADAIASLRDAATAALAPCFNAWFGAILVGFVAAVLVSTAGAATGAAVLSVRPRTCRPT